MEDTLITFETAKLAKEKGFKEICFAAFHRNNRSDGWFETGIISQSEYFKFPLMNNGDKIAVLQKDYIHTILRPTQSLLAKWLREKYNIHITSQIGNLDFINTYHYEIRYIYKNKFACKVNGNFKTYEEAYEKGLQEALKLI